MHALTHRLTAWSLALVGALLLASPLRAGEIEDAFRPSAKDAGRIVDHSAWGALLTAHVVPGADGLNHVLYERFKSTGHLRLRAYIASLEAVDVRQLGRAEQFAFWSNLYNAKTIDIVLEHYPVASIKDINLGGGLVATLKGGPWAAKVVKVNGQALSLDDIEHVILRGLFKDPRVHYAVNCASIGCPNLQREAFTGVRLEAQLDAAARQFINSPRGARVEASGLVVSSIYKWFQADFEGSESGVIRHLARYADEPLRRQLERATAVSSYAYDWRLNDASADTFVGARGSGPAGPLR